MTTNVLENTWEFIFPGCETEIKILKGDFEQEKTMRCSNNGYSLSPTSTSLISTKLSVDIALSLVVPMKI